MQIYGKVKRQTDNAILFRIWDKTNELPEAFHEKELWFPLSQCLGGAQRHTDGLMGDAIFAPQYLRVPDALLQLKGVDLGCDFNAFRASKEDQALTEAARRLMEEDEDGEWLLSETELAEFRSELADFEARLATCKKDKEASRLIWYIKRNKKWIRATEMARQAKEANHAA